MEQLTELLIEIIRNLFGRWGYLVVLFGMMFENLLFLGLVIPGVFVLLLAGLSAHEGLLDLRVALLCHAVVVGLLVALRWVAAPYLGTVYLVGVAAVALLLAYEHWLVRPDDLSRVNQAFFQVNAVVSIGLFAVVLLELVLAGG